MWLYRLHTHEAGPECYHMYMELENIMNYLEANTAINLDINITCQDKNCPKINIGKKLGSF